MSNQDNIDAAKKKLAELNTISPSMCLAKWLQSTTTLYNGMTHSCHHPKQHKIDVSDLKRNYTGLHNTPKKLSARSEMLNGIQTRECDYCWRIENLSGPSTMSDRTYKSSSTWAWPKLQEVLDSGLGDSINPTYFEVAFEHTCNFKCIYCIPDVSSRWLEEVKTYGGYKLTEMTIYDPNYLQQTNTTPIHYKDYNPYIEAFWKWWPDLYQSLDTFRITGGEPLLSEHTWRVFDYIIAHPRKDLTLAINTNMGAPKHLIDKLIQYCVRLAPLVKSVQVYTSAEATGKQCEYIRYGMDWNEFETNCCTFLSSVPETIGLHFMVTANLLCSSTFEKFLEWIIMLRSKFNTSIAYNRVPIMIAYLRWPVHLAMYNLPSHLKEKYAKDWLAVVQKYLIVGNVARFYLEELDQINRLISFMNSISSTDIQAMDLYAFQSEADKRRGTNLLETFPELTDYYNFGKKLSTI